MGIDELTSQSYTDTDAKEAVTAFDVGLGNVDNKALSNVEFSDLQATRYTDAEARAAVGASDVGLGNVENVALSNAGWSDLNISQSDVDKSDVGLSNVTDDEQVVDAGSTPSILSDTSANRPAPGTTGRLFVETDTGLLLRDMGSEWKALSGRFNAHVHPDTFTLSSSGAKSVTGVPFKPTAAQFKITYPVSQTNQSNDGDSAESFVATMNGYARNDSGTTVQQVTASGLASHSEKINDNRSFASSAHCIGISVADSTGSEIGKITAKLTSWNDGGFTIDVDTFDIPEPSIVVQFTAYRSEELSVGSLNIGEDASRVLENAGGVYFQDYLNVADNGDNTAGVSVDAAALDWANLGIAQSDVSASDVNLGNVENTALSNAGWADLNISQSDVDAADVSLGNVENKALSSATWADLAISQSDVSKGDVGLSNVTDDEQVIDKGAAPSIQAGTNTNRPAAGTAGRLYIETDTNKIFRDDGTSWNLFAEKPANLSWSDLGISQSDVDKSDVGLGNVENTALSAAGWTDIGISQSDVDAADVGLGNVENTALSNATWADLAIGRSDVGKADVGLGNVTNDEQVVDGGGAGELQAGDESNRPSAGTADRWYLATDNGKLFYDNGSSWLLVAATPANTTASDVGLGRVDNIDHTISTSDPSGGQDGDVWFKV